MTDLPTIPNRLPDGPFKGMPQWLKEPSCYAKVQKFIIETLAGTHSHGEVIDWATCPQCQRRFYERRDVIMKLGFKSMGQYLAWQKVMRQIHAPRKDPLKKYNDI